MSISVKTRDGRHIRRIRRDVLLGKVLYKGRVHRVQYESDGPTIRI